MSGIARRRRGRLGWGLFFCGPATLLYTTFLLLPMVTALWYSFFAWKGIDRGAFVGPRNYLDVLTTYPYAEAVRRALGHNLLFFGATMLIQNSIGLGLALLLHRAPRATHLLRTLYATPYLISPLVVGYIWSMLLSPSFGPLNAFFEAVGWDALSRPWLGDQATALPAAVLINAWQWIGGPVLILGAALGTVPVELEEAAGIDGASAWTTFWQGLSSALAMLMFCFSFGVSIAIDRWLRRREVTA